jgi:hypothetical protein
MRNLPLILNRIPHLLLKALGQQRQTRLAGRLDRLLLVIILDRHGHPNPRRNINLLQIFFRGRIRFVPLGHEFPGELVLGENPHLGLKVRQPGLVGGVRLRI